QGPFSVDHLDVYAVTLAPGTVTPPNRDFLKPEHVIATIPVQPPPDPEAGPPETSDPRPLPGEVVTFAEKLTDAQLVPQVITKPPPPEKPRKPSSTAPAAPAPVPSPSAAAAASAAPPPGLLVLTRIYAVQGVPKKGKG